MCEEKTHGGFTDAEGGADRFEHRVHFYSDDDEYLAGLLPRINAAVEAGAPVVIAVGRSKTRLLRAELNGAADHVTFVPIGEVGRNPARLIPVWQDFVERNERSGSLGLGIGEPIWPGRTRAEVSECELHESLLNVAFEEGPAWSLICLYDTRSLPGGVIERARRTHPLVSDAGGAAASGEYMAFPLDEPFAGELQPPPADAVVLDFTAQDLPSVRSFIEAQAVLSGIEQHRADDFVLAVSELAANSVRHGGGRGTVRVWRMPGEFLCEVSDEGTITDALVGRRKPGVEDLRGRGLWMVNSLCDLAQIRSGPDGTTVRAHVRLR